MERLFLMDIEEVHRFTARVDPSRICIFADPGLIKKLKKGQKKNGTVVIRFGKKRWIVVNEETGLLLLDAKKRTEEERLTYFAKGFIASEFDLKEQASILVPDEKMMETVPKKSEKKDTSYFVRDKVVENIPREVLPFLEEPRHFTNKEIYEIREKMHLSRKSFAKLFNVTPRNIAYWESNDPTHFPTGGNCRLLELLSLGILSGD